MLVVLGMTNPLVLSLSEWGLLMDGGHGPESRPARFLTGPVTAPSRRYITGRVMTLVTHSSGRNCDSQP
jgi:hypothetical protein